MTKTLVRTGNSIALVMNKDMLAHLGIESGEVEVVPFQDGYIVRKPRSRASFDEAVAETLAEYDGAFKELAK